MGRRTPSPPPAPHMGRQRVRGLPSCCQAVCLLPGPRESVLHRPARQAQPRLVANLPEKPAHRPFISKNPGVTHEALRRAPKDFVRQHIGLHLTHRLRDGEQSGPLRLKRKQQQQQQQQSFPSSGLLEQPKREGLEAALTGS